MLELGKETTASNKFWEHVPRLFVLFATFRLSVAKQSYMQGHDEHWLTEFVVCFSNHSTDIAMKECAAYGGVTAHSVMEAVYEHPQ